MTQEMKTDDKTLYGIKEDTERYILVSWSLIVFISSLLGDSIILLGSIKHKAIKQHKLIVAVIQHLAVCDLLLTVFMVLPDTVALITDGWVLGEVLCHVEQNVTWICGALNIYLTSCMTTLKLLIIKQPLRATTWKSKLGHKICSVMWFLVLVLFAPGLVPKMTKLGKTLFFSYKTYKCNYNFSSPSVPRWHKMYRIIPWFFVTIGGYSLMLVTTIPLVMAARKAASRRNVPIRWQGLTTVLLTVLVLFVSALPWYSLYFSQQIGVDISETSYRIGNRILFLNIMANFFVYSLTVPSFRRFVRLQIFQVLSGLTRCFRLRVQPLQQRQVPTQEQNTAHVRVTTI